MFGFKVECIFAFVKRYASILLTLALILPQLLQLTAMVDYVIRMDAIEEAYCVNKDKPELSCHGSCHLKSELANIEEPGPKGSQPAQAPVKPTFRVLDFIVNSTSVQISSRIQVPVDDFHVPAFMGNTHTSFSNRILAPPQIIS